MAALTVSNWLALVVIAGAEMIKLYRTAWKPENERRRHTWTFGIILVDMLRTSSENSPFNI